MIGTTYLCLSLAAEIFESPQNTIRHVYSAPKNQQIFIPFAVILFLHFPSMLLVTPRVIGQHLNHPAIGDNAAGAGICHAG